MFFLYDSLSMSPVHDTPNALIIGIYLMKMFEKTGWLLTGMFDCLTDANIDPGRSWGGHEKS